jgi:hypothetical protein
MTQITAELRNWQKFESSYGDVYIGDIWEDVHQRWSNGTLIRTSLVQKEEGDLVYTLNSVYKLVGEPYKA